MKLPPDGPAVGRRAAAAAAVGALLLPRCGAFAPAFRGGVSLGPFREASAPARATVLRQAPSDANVAVAPTAPATATGRDYASYTPSQIAEARRAAEAAGRRAHDPFAMNALFVNVEERPDPRPCSFAADSPAPSLPADLPPGCLLRIGPNGATAEEGFLDGDGMVHAITIPPPGSGADVLYSSTYVDTKGRRLEREKGTGATFGGTLGAAPAGLPMLANLLRNGVTFGTLDVQKDTCNTALAVSGSRVLALMEQSPPSEVRFSRDGRMRTVESFARLDGAVPRAPINGGALGAHGRTDPHTGERVHASYRSHARPYVRVDTFDDDWRLASTVGIDTPVPVMVHDLALTPSYVVMLDFPLTIRPERMMLRNKFPVEYEPGNGSRIGLTPRGRSDDATAWFDVEDGVVLHAVNAHEREEDGTVAVHAFKSVPDGESSFVLEYAPAFLYEWILDPKTGEVVSERCMNPDVTVEFPQVPASVTGERAAAVYGLVATGIGGPMLQFSTPQSGVVIDAVAQFALEDDAVPAAKAGDVVSRFDLPEGWHFVSEPTIVEKTSKGHYVLLVATYVPQKEGVGEDHVAVANDGTSMKSQLIVLDGDRLSEGPVTKVDLPYHVNYGLHSEFVHWDLLE